MRPLLVTLSQITSLQKQNIPHYLKLMRVDRPIGTFLLLWPTLWSLWLAAEGVPSAKNLVIFVLGCFLMRSAGCCVAGPTRASSTACSSCSRPVQTRSASSR